MTEQDVPTKKHLPRDSAGSLELQGGTGGQDVTFRVRTPESIDARRTNPNAPFVAAMSDSVGSSSPRWRASSSKAATCWT
jgi:hypothetical protein